MIIVYLFTNYISDLYTEYKDKAKALLEGLFNIKIYVQYFKNKDKIIILYLM